MPLSQPIKTSVVESTDIWLGMGRAKHFHAPLSLAFRGIIRDSMIEAAVVYRERHASKTRKALIASLNSSGFRTTAQARLGDKNDSIGLVGEIIAEHFSVSRKYEILWAKWRAGGTSKSPGIDLVARIGRNSTSNLRLIESKHLHDELKGKNAVACIPLIKVKLSDGIEEFDQDRTRLNLAGILRKMSKMIRHLKAAMSNPKAIERSHDFVRSSLAQNEYSSEIVASLDSKYCTNSTLSHCVANLQLPSSIGKHTVNLIILACDSLEATTDEIC